MAKAASTVKPTILQMIAGTPPDGEVRAGEPSQLIAPGCCLMDAATAPGYVMDAEGNIAECPRWMDEVHTTSSNTSDSEPCDEIRQEPDVHPQPPDDDITPEPSAPAPEIRHAPSAP